MRLELGKPVAIGDALWYEHRYIITPLDRLCRILQDPLRLRLEEAFGNSGDFEVGLPSDCVDDALWELSDET